jgi:hypothetical protein
MEKQKTKIKRKTKGRKKDSVCVVVSMTASLAGRSASILHLSVVLQAGRASRKPSTRSTRS